MPDVNRRKTLEQLVAETREVIATGELSDNERSDLEARCAAVEQMSAEERASHNHFLEHMPNDDADVALIVLKGHLLIEQRVHEFIAERILAPNALDGARLTSHQAISLAESLCLPNEEPQQLWALLRRVNSLRNALAHNLEPKDIENRISGLVGEYSKLWPVHSGLCGVLAHAFGQLSELCRLARRPEFRTRGKP